MSDTNSLAEAFKTNEALWDKLTKIHQQSDFYNVEAFKAGESSLKTVESQVLSQVNGKSILHLQCHFGMDTLSWARKGAQVTGVDFSKEAIQTARELSEELAIPARFVQSNVYELEDHLHEQFDIVFTSYGVISWLNDLKEWGRIISRFLKPGGIFLIVEFHPLLWCFDEGFNAIQYPYFNTEMPVVLDNETAYADHSQKITQKEYSWNHSIGEVVEALRWNGLSIEELKEYPFSAYNIFPDMEEVKTDHWVLEKFGNKIPYMFAVIASKPEE